jgi:hypothetical protein
MLSALFFDETDHRRRQRTPDDTTPERTQLDNGGVGRRPPFGRPLLETITKASRHVDADGLIGLLLFDNG